MTDHLARRLGEFALIPRSLASRATGNTVRLWCVLWCYSGNGTHAAWPSQELLAYELELSVRTVQRCLKELEDLGMLTCTTRLGTSSLYTLEWNPVDNPKGHDSSVVSGYDTTVVPPTTPMSYKERLSELDLAPDLGHDTKLSREQVRDIVTKSAFCPTCREKLGRCLCD